MRVVDTSAWIEWFTDSRLADQLADLIPAPTDCLMPTMVQLELRKWFLREQDEEAADEVLAFTELCRVEPLDTRLAVLAAETALAHKLPTADAIIYASALSHDADVLTCDSHFEGLPGVILLRKIAV